MPPCLKLKSAGDGVSIASQPEEMFHIRPTAESASKHRDDGSLEFKHGGDSDALHLKTLDLSARVEFLVGTRGNTASRRVAPSLPAARGLTAPTTAGHWLPNGRYRIVCRSSIDGVRISITRQLLMVRPAMRVGYPAVRPLASVPVLIFVGRNFSAGTAGGSASMAGVSDQ